MKKVFWFILIINVGVFAITAAAKTPDGDIALYYKSVGNAEPVAENESLVRLIPIEARWETRKKLSEPYLLNRYTRPFSMSCFVIVPEAKKGMVSRTISADGSGDTQARFIQNDNMIPI